MITQNANEYEIFFISSTPLQVFFNIAVGSAAMDIFDISNPQQPTVVTSYLTRLSEEGFRNVHYVHSPDLFFCFPPVVIMSA